MTTNAHTHCPTCIEHATDTIREGMIEVIMDDAPHLTYEQAERYLDDDAVRENVIEYLDGIIEQQRQTHSSHPENTCYFVHTDDL